MSANTLQSSKPGCKPHTKKDLAQQPLEPAVVKKANAMKRKPAIAPGHLKVIYIMLCDVYWYFPVFKTKLQTMHQKKPGATDLRASCCKSSKYHIGRTCCHSGSLRGNLPSISQYWLTPFNWQSQVANHVSKRIWHNRFQSQLSQIR